MYCSKCGAVNDDQAAFCRQCGASLKPGSQTVSPSAQGTKAAVPVAVEYAGFWRRFAAAIIDGLILSVASTTVIFVSLGVAYPFTLVAGWLYYSLMESSSTQATLGKMALGIKVTDLDGRRISFGRATGRYFGKIVSAIILLAGYIMIAFTEKKQGLHDMMANTLVLMK